MNPKSQSGGAADDGKNDKPNNGEPIAAPEQRDAPAATTENPKEEKTTVPSPEEQHFFHTDGANGDAGNHSPAASPLPPPDSPQPSPHMPHDGQEVTWTAPEFVAHEKGASWYLMFGVAAVVLIALVALITRSIYSSVIAVIICVIFGIGAGRKPRDMNYAVDGHGVGAGRSFHPYSDFRAFSMTTEGNLINVTLIPLKRFMPPMTLYMDPANQNPVVDVILRHLPLEDHQADPIERLMSRIRF